MNLEVLDYTLNRFEEETLKALVERNRSSVELRRSESEIERNIANQVRGLSDGYSKCITDEIARLEYRTFSACSNSQAVATR